MWRGPSNPGQKPGPRPRELKSRVRLLPEYLKEADYATGIFGKWHLGYESPNTPNSRGFDEFFGFLSGAHPYRAAPRNPFLRNGDPYRPEWKSAGLAHLPPVSAETVWGAIQGPASRL